MKNLLLLRPPTKVQKVIPIGLLYLASYAKKMVDDLQVKIIDLRMCDTFDINQFAKQVAYFKPDIVGISSLSLEINETLHLARFIKDTFRESLLLLGGPLASTEYRVLEQLNIFDHIIVGEGEEIVSSIIGDKIPKENKILFAQDFREVDINYIKFPDYNLIDVPKYFQLSSHEAFQIHKKYAPIFTSRGCPFSCAFCFHAFGKKIRFRDINNVIEEIEFFVSRYGIKELHIEDDVFNIDKKRVLKFFELLNAHKIKIAISFPNGLTYKTLDEDIIQLMKKNGVCRVCLGIETVSDDMMNLISKKHNVPELNKIISLLNKYRILAHGFFIAGFPTETIDDFNKTINFIIKSKLHTFRISRYIPFQGTELYTQFHELFKQKDIEDIQKKRYHSTDINYSNIPTDYINKMIVSANIKFYMNPIRIFNILSAMNKICFLRNILEAAKYIFTGQVKDSA